MSVFFTADTHFGHRRIVEYAHRPFGSADEMDECLVEAWNARVTPRDTIYHLGDFALGEPERIRRVFGRLKGVKHLVLGNHDRPGEMASLGWAGVDRYLRRSIGETTFVMCHYPFVTWERRHRNGDDRVASVNVFGHVHSTPADPKHAWDRCQYDVGVDNNGYAPVASDEVVAALLARMGG